MHASGARAEGLTASQRLFAAIGLPPPPPLTEAEEREFKARIQRAQAKAAEFYATDGEQRPE